MPKTVSQSRALVAVLSQHRADNDPELVNARRDLAEANLAQYIEKIVAKAPPLTPAQRERLAGLLRPSTHA